MRVINDTYDNDRNYHCNIYIKTKFISRLYCWKCCTPMCNVWYDNNVHDIFMGGCFCVKSTCLIYLALHTVYWYQLPLCRRRGSSYTDPQIVQVFRVNIVDDFNSNVHTIVKLGTLASFSSPSSRHGMLAVPPSKILQPYFSGCGPLHRPMS